MPVPESARSCTACGSDAFKTVGNGTPSVVYDYVAPHFRRRIYRRETVACRCGSSIVTAPCPEKVFDRSQYTPGFVAYLIVAQCADAIPLYRLEKQFARVGVPVARSTMTDLFHRAAELLAPLSEPNIEQSIERIGRSPIVSADETPIKMQSSTKRAFIWTFLGEQLVGYVFSTGRSGDTPARVSGSKRPSRRAHFTSTVSPKTMARRACRRRFRSSWTRKGPGLSDASSVASKLRSSSRTSRLLAQEMRRAPRGRPYLTRERCAGGGAAAQVGGRENLS